MKPVRITPTRALLAGYAAIAYLGFVGVIVWAIAFVADGPFLTGVDHGPHASAWVAAAIDLGLLAVFAGHHSVMARDRSKQVLAKVIPAAAERSTYVLVADLLFALVLWQWRPITALAWDVHEQPWHLLLWGGYGLGWIIAIASTFMIDHFDFLGVRQAATAPGRYRPPEFQERWLYAWVRHPLMLGVLMALWITPRMSLGHLLLAGASTAYVAVGVRLEEGDLRRHLPETYAEYAGRVPAVIPSARPRRARSAPNVTDVPSR